MRRLNKVSVAATTATLTPTNSTVPLVKPSTVEPELCQRGGGRASFLRIGMRSNWLLVLMSSATNRPATAGSSLRCRMTPQAVPIVCGPGSSAKEAETIGVCPNNQKRTKCPHTSIGMPPHVRASRKATTMTRRF